MCHVPGCGKPAAGYSNLCATHGKTKARHGHPLQTAVTREELWPYESAIQKFLNTRASPVARVILEAQWVDLEVILGLVKPQVSPPGTAAFIAKFTKFRAKGDGRIRPYCWALGDAGWNVEEDLEDSLGETLRAFTGLNYVSQQEIADALGVAKGTISKRIDRLIAESRATRDSLRECLGKAKRLREGTGGESLEIDPEDDEDLPF